MVIPKFTISWFRREAGLLFFTIILVLALVLTNGSIGGQDMIPYVYAQENQPQPGETPSDPLIPEASAPKEAAAKEKVTVVIDPGHGGENLGGEYEDYTEKEMTLIVAEAMKAELEQYEGIEVYLTRTGDVDLSLEERCEFAASVNADFLFCLHFNLSGSHTLFGAETWISAFGEQYSKGYSFASIEMELLEGLGLYSRGIKTRLNDKGIDYYGIIRHATERNMPCVLIEHCHLDQENDKPFYDHKDKLVAFGKLDAEAVAKYYGLKSESLGKDFSGYEKVSVPVPSQTMKPDTTEPDICMIELKDQNMENGEVTVSVSATDYDSGMLYYTYSYDGGETFSELQRWPDKSKDTFAFTITIPSGIVPEVVVNAYNGYDLYTTSNTLSLPSMRYGDDKEDTVGNKQDEGNTENRPSAGGYTGQSAAEDGSGMGKEAGEDAVESSSTGILSDKDYENATLLRTGRSKEPEEMSMGYFLKVCLICAALVLAMALSMVMILRGCKKRRRRRRR